MVAVCGGMRYPSPIPAEYFVMHTCFSATGAGKSSLLNAILDGTLSFRRALIESRQIELFTMQTTLYRLVVCEVSDSDSNVLIRPSQNSCWYILACTAVVTEIAYHTKKTIDADISFLSEGEWRQELEVLLDDLVDENGEPKRSTDMRSDAGVAWSKVSQFLTRVLTHPHVFLFLSGSRSLSHSHRRANGWYDSRSDYCQGSA